MRVKRNPPGALRVEGKDPGSPASPANDKDIVKIDLARWRPKISS